MKIFKNKMVIIIGSIVLCLVIILLSSYFMLKSALKLNGNNVININYGENYKEIGAYFKVFNKDFSKNISIKNNINNEKVGQYKVIYKIKFLIFDIERKRIVNVVDKIDPIITLKGSNEVNICTNAVYEEEGYGAIDEYDGDITKNVVKTTNDKGNIIYKVTDSSGNKAKIERIINKEDNEAPVVKLKGPNTVYIKINSVYNDLGYEVTDNCDSNVKVEIINNININMAGIYTVKYEATDESGNKSVVDRIVIVCDSSTPGVIYLTFDDGPSDTGTTTKILYVLKNQGVHATFFVTSKGSDYLIRREFDEGHTLALHTSTHNYSYIYSSIDNYFYDLKVVQDRIYNITGYRTNIIRFPGGSNNTVSNNYYYGIMDLLTKEVISRGYSYYDWNVSGCDAGGCTSSDCVYNSVIKGLSKNKNNVVLLHDTNMTTAYALNDIIYYAKMNGYLFKTIDNSTYPIRFK